MLRGGGRRAEDLFLYFSFFKNPEKTDSLPPDFAFPRRGQHQGRS